MEKKRTFRVENWSGRQKKEEKNSTNGWMFVTLWSSMSIVSEDDIFRDEMRRGWGWYSRSSAKTKIFIFFDFVITMCWVVVKLCYPFGISFLKVCLCFPCRCTQFGQWSALFLDKVVGCRGSIGWWSSQWGSFAPRNLKFVMESGISRPVGMNFFICSTDIEIYILWIVFVSSLCGYS